MSDTSAESMATAPVSMDLPHESFRSNAGKFGAAIEDLTVGLGRVSLWSTLAWEEFGARYHRSFFGILWAFFGFIMFAVAIIFFVGAIMGPAVEDMVLHILFGFLFFQLLSSQIMDGANVFVTSAGWISSVRMPLSVFVYRGIARNLITFFFSVLGAGLMLIVTGYVPPAGAWWAIPGLIVTIFNTVWVYLLLGTITSRFRDFGHLLGNFVRMAIFFTPVMWLPGDGGLRGFIGDINPLTHFIEIMREPLLHGTVPILSWQIVAGMTVVGNILGLLVFVRFRPKIVFWI
ncbi:MAG: ABC transporter permease [Pseudomonadota bacterium]